MQQQQAQLDQRALLLQRHVEAAPEALRKELRELVDLSWIYHDSALEGVVYSPRELLAALRGEAAPDPALISTFDEIRQAKSTIDFVRSLAENKATIVDADLVKDVYLSLAPDEVDGKKPPAFRKEIPLHRLYFHEIAAPDKIPALLKSFSQWLVDPETRRTTHVIRLAAKAHFQLLHIFPYPKHGGRVARFVMNLILIAAGYPPAIIHSTERQRYYDALKTNENALAMIVKDALTSSIESGIRFVESRLPVAAPSPMKKAKGKRGRADEDESDSMPPRALARELERTTTALPARRRAEVVPPPVEVEEEAPAEPITRVTIPLEKPRAEKPREKPRAEKLRAEKPRADKPRAEKAAVEKAAVEKAAVEKVAVEKAAVEKAEKRARAEAKAKPAKPTKAAAKPAKSASRVTKPLKAKAVKPKPAKPAKAARPVAKKAARPAKAAPKAKTRRAA